MVISTSHPEILCCFKSTKEIYLSKVLFLEIFKSGSAPDTVYKNNENPDSRKRAEYLLRIRPVPSSGPYVANPFLVDPSALPVGTKIRKIQFGTGEQEEIIDIQF